ncbi:MAG: hypothetical protein HKN22_01020, partial [Bacteroidia bacterium]|nr:hypothetical protein [Bacteroidia bacterium]
MLGIRWLLLFSFTTIVLHTYAGHRAGGNYQWECINDSTFIVKWTAYIDCDHSVDPITRYCLTGSLGGDPNNGTYPITFSSSNPHPIEDPCSPCVYPWLTEVYYTDTIVLQSPISPWYAIEFCDGGNRPGTPTSSSAAYYNFTVVKPSPCNTTAYPTSFPDVIFEFGDTATLYNNYIDPDGDSLVFTLGDCFESFLNPISYNAPWSGSNPLSSSIGWFIDSVGNITFVPSAVMNGPICLYIQEYRADSLIHQSVNEFFVSTIAPPPPPNIVEEDSNSVVIAGEDTCIKINYSKSFSPGYEITAAVVLDSVLIANGASWVSLPPSDANNYGFFCWDPPCDFEGKGPYFIELYLVDNACPSNNRDTVIYQVDINPGLTPTAQFKSYSDTCSNGFSDSIVNLSINDTAWFWEINNMLLGSVDSYTVRQPYHTFQPGTNVIRLITKNRCKSDTIIDTFEVNTIPTALAGNDTTVCHYDTISLNGQTNGIVYFWSPSNGLSDSTSANPLFYPNANSTYIWNATAANGCINTDTINVDVSFPYLIKAGNDTTICELTNIQLGGSPTGPPGATYLWSPSLTLNFNNASNPIGSPLIDSGSIQYFLEVSNIFGCIERDSIHVNVRQAPETDAGIGGFICQGQSLQLQASGANTYSWIGANLSNYTTDNPNASPTITTTYTVFGTDANGCVASDEVVLYVFGDDEVEIIALDTSLCPGDTFNLDATVRQNFCNDYEALLIPFAPISGVGDTIFIDRDDYSNNIDLGFSFEFFCEYYTSVKFSSNGFITFGNDGNERNPQTLPDPNEPDNLIAYAWDEWDPNFGNNGEVIQYYTVGVSPNRIFVIDIDSMRHRNDANAYLRTQIQLFETSNYIEIHTTSQSFGSGDLTMGIENSNGSIAFNIIGRNNNTWTVNPIDQDAWRFEPVTTPNTIYSWTPGSSLNDSTSPTPFGIYSGPISYSVEVTSGSCVGKEDIIFLHDASLAVTTVPVQIAICDSGSVPIHAFVNYDTIKPQYICDDYQLAAIPFDPLSGDGTHVNLSDNSNTKVKVGFDFRFYCNRYDEVYINSNGFLQFDKNDNGCCSGQTLPNPAKPNNVIAFAWEDLDPDNSGEINYYTTGFSPNRIFVVNFIDIPHSPGPGPNKNVTAQVQLHEYTHTIQIHIADQPDSLGIHTVGIENEFGDHGHPVPNFNGTNWHAQNVAYEFTLNQVLGDPPPIIYTWSPAFGLSDSTVSSPIATVKNYTEYLITVSNGACTASDTAKISIQPDTSLKVLTKDVIACPQSDVPLNAETFYDIVQPDIECDNYLVSAIPHHWTFGPSNSLDMEDEETIKVDIGFDFNFFCKRYDQVRIASNGFLTFSDDRDGCCEGHLLPNSADPRELIAFAWNNLDPGDGANGLIEYYTVGSIPNRIFVVNFIDVPHFPGPGPNNDITVQVKLFESTDVIEIHTVKQPDGSGIHTMGIENRNENKAHWVPGRNADQWTAFNEAWRFEPNNLTPTITNIFYKWWPQSLISDTSILNPVAHIGDTSVDVTFTAIYNGCIATDTVSITVIQDTLVEIQLDNDTACPGAPIYLTPKVNIDIITPVRSCNEYNVDGILYDPIPGNGIAVLLDNDDAQNALPIGFDFEFYCNIYDQFSISSNGFLQFDANDDGCCDGQVLPDAANPNNLIAFAWENLNPEIADGGGGQIYYFMTGEAPNRKLVVNFVDVPHYNSPLSSTDSITAQVILYETTNHIEIHTKMQPDITGFHTMGIENKNGTAGTVVPGRNSSNWTATPEAWRFEPVYIKAPGDGPNYSWSPSLGIDDSTNLNVTSVNDTSIEYIFTVEYDFCKYNNTIDIVRMQDPNFNILSEDISACPGEVVSLVANFEFDNDTSDCVSCNDYVVDEIIYSPIVGSGATVGLTNDQVSTAQNIGFDFLFFCDYYKDFHISSNGFITFPNPNWSVHGAGDGDIIPDNNDPNNLIAFAWEDLDPATNGIIQYWVSGSAPNRILVVDFDSVAHDNTGADYVSAQIHLYESDGTIEIHVDEQPDGYSIHTLGIENFNSSLGFTPEGTNGSNWGFQQKAFRFSPQMEKLPKTTYLWTPGTGLNNDSIPYPNAVSDTSINYIISINHNYCLQTDTFTVSRGPDTAFAVTSSRDSVLCEPSFLWLSSKLTFDSVECTDFKYAVEPIEYDTIFGGGTSVPLGDNELSANIPIGFNFDFFCNSYTNLKISSNGFVHFGGGIDHGCCVPQLIPDPANTNNNIYFAWNDLDNADIEYFNSGTAPNRKFVINFNDAEQIGKAKPANNIFVQLVLHETSNIIDINVKRIPAKDVLYTIGIENIDGSQGFSAPGKNAINGKTFFESYRFTPTFNDFPTIPGPVYQWTPTSAVDSSHLRGPDVYVDSTTQFVISATYNGCTTYDTTLIIINDYIIIADSIVNASCYGFADGEIHTSLANGGYGSITYAWSDGQITSSAFGLIAGKYYLTVTDSIGCIAIDSFIITEPLQLRSIEDSTAVSCNGGNDGTITVTIRGGTWPYSWSHNPALNDSVALVINLTAGLYSSVITDSNGCVISVDVNITEPPALTFTSDTTESLCFGDNNGTATVNTSGGTPPYTFLWSDGQTTSLAVGLTAGSYFVTITDANGCFVSPIPGDSILIKEPTQLVIDDLDSIDVSCYGFNDGAAWVTASGGVSPYTYLWNDGQTNDTAFNLIAGAYGVIVTDVNGCNVTNTSSDSILVNQPPLLTAVLDSIDVICFGGSDGFAIAASAGGTTPYAYLWSDAQTNDTAFALIAGMYTVTITDANSCILIDSILVVEPTSVSATINGNNISCNAGSDGNAWVTPAGGVGNYTFLWGDAQTTDTAVNLAAGWHYVTVTDSNACSYNDSILLTEPPLPLSFISDTTEPLCFRDSNATATVTASGGTAPYTFLWSDGQTTSTAVGLSAGNYFVTITDANGCFVSPALGDSILIIEPPMLTISNLDSLDVSCFGFNDGEAYVFVSGGVGPYTYLWNDGQTNDTASNLFAGAYGIVVIDANGCTTTNTSTDSIRVNQPALLTVLLDSIHVSCIGGNDGSTIAAPIGGTAPYTYLWSDAQTNDTASALIAGMYTVTITDANSCIIIDSILVVEPTSVSGLMGAENLLCNSINDGRAWIIPSGGVGSYTYLWGDGQTTDTAINLFAGWHYVTLTDSNSCTYDDSILITQPPTPVTFISDTTHTSCFGINDGTATATASGGIPPYSFLWSDGQTTSQAIGLGAGNYFVTVTDANGCTVSPLAGDSIQIQQATTLLIDSLDSLDVSCFGFNDGAVWVFASGGTPPYTFLWSDGQSNDTAFNLFAGTYRVTVTDANSCATSNNIFPVSIDEPAILQANITSFPVSCFGLSDGYVVSTPSGGTLPYTFLWSDASTNDTINNLSAGQYFLTLTDGNGCVSVDSILVIQPTIVSGVVGSQNLRCNLSNDGLAWITPSGGVGSYTFVWADAQTNDTAVNLAAGWHYVTVTDSNGCAYNDSVLLTQPPTPLTFISDTTETTCFGSSDGSATVTAMGGTPPYAFLWSDGQTTSTAVGLLAGNYFVTVTDSAGCNVSPAIGDSIEITQPTLLVIDDLDSIDVSCFGFNDGSAWVTASGGVLPYSYLWSDGQSNDTAFNLIAGAYGVVVTDANGCNVNNASDSIIVNQPVLLTVVLDSIDVLCFGGSDGYAIAMPAGGTAPYSYLWSDAQTNDTASVLISTFYTVTITDANSCVAVDSIFVAQPTIVSGTMGAQDLRCNSGNDGLAWIIPSGGVGNYTFIWADSQTNDTAFSLAAGWHYVTVTDSNGCDHNDSILLTQPPTPLTFISDTTETTCFGSSDGSATVTAMGGTPPYAFLWSDGQTTSTAVGLGAGNYFVTVSDAAGCQVSPPAGDSIEITQPTPLIIDGIDSLDVSCFGFNDGAAWVTASGGTLPYTYLWSDGQTNDT